MIISPITRQKNQARQGFGSQSPDFLGWFRQPVSEPRKRLKPPKKNWHQSPFPVEAKKFWRELPEVVRLATITVIGMHLVLFILWAYYAFVGK